jgi:hypothetical protein
MHRSILITALLVVLASRHAAAASPAYLGCFRRAALAPDERAATDLPAAASPADLAAACGTYCSSRNHPLASILLSGRCACSSKVPDAAAALPAGSCTQAALSSSSSAAVALFYSHSSGCTPASVPAGALACCLVFHTYSCLPQT